MEIENVNIYDLVPSQIIQLISKLQRALEIVKNRKSTVSKVATYEKEVQNCPFCAGEHIIKYGHTKTGVQNFWCKDCLRKFNAITGTIFAGTHLTYEQIDIFLQCYHDKISIRKTAKRMKVSKDTVHLLRLKMNGSYSKIRETIQLAGEVEGDELYLSINLKGTKPEKMPRFSKPRKSKGTTTQGISKHKICIVSAIDEKDNIFLEIAGNGPVTSKMIDDVLTPKMKKVSKLVTDCKSSYESIAKNNRWNLKQIKSCGHTDTDGNSLANINSVHSDWEHFAKGFRGISTKHLQGYLDWFMFDKYLNYHIEENNQLEYILNNCMNSTTDISSTNIYENHSPLDFAEIYSDYNYIYQP